MGHCPSSTSRIVPPETRSSISLWSIPIYWGIRAAVDHAALHRHLSVDHMHAEDTTAQTSQPS
jgi:hypothetical protein